MAKVSVVADGRNGVSLATNPQAASLTKREGGLRRRGAIIYPRNHDRDIAIHLTIGSFAMGGRLVSGAGNVFAERLTLLWRK